MIKTILGDITKINTVEAIVNAANSSLLGGERMHKNKNYLERKRIICIFGLVIGCIVHQTKNIMLMAGGISSNIIVGDLWKRRYGLKQATINTIMRNIS